MPDAERPIPCRFGCPEPAIAIYWFDGGCLAERGWRLQPLCWHHSQRAYPIGTAKLLLDLTDPQFWRTR